MNVVVDMRKGGRKEMIEGCITLFMRELKLEKSKSTLFVFSKKILKKKLVLQVWFTRMLKV
jgi:hypothetical protein